MTDVMRQEQRRPETEMRTYDLTFSQQLGMMADAFWKAKVRNRIFLFSAGLLVIILATAYGQIRLNEWNAPFYNAIERRNLPDFIEQLYVFAAIAGTLLLLNVVQTWLNQMTALCMRDGLARDLVDQWLKSKRAMRLVGSGAIAINPDQRLHDDARNLAESTTALSIGLVNASIILISFIGVLWTLSEGFSLNFQGQSVPIPGYMVWAVLLYAGSAAMLSKMVGRKLVDINAERYSKEAELRFSLMRASENLTAITLARGEENERRRINTDIDGVLGVIRYLAVALTNLTWVSAGYGWLAQVAPILISAPVYFSGHLTFGGLMMAVGAFNQVNVALRWYVDNFGAIASWKATLMRVAAFRCAVLDMDEPVANYGTHITYGTAPADRLVMDNVAVSADAEAEAVSRGFRLDENHLVVEPADRVMLNGDSGANRHLMFAAMSRLWPWGRGAIDLPPEEDTLFMPQTGYFPSAPLREVLSYPQDPSLFSDAALSDALRKSGLDHFTVNLDARARWDRALDQDDQARLRVANALVLKPRWIIIDDMLEGLETETQESLARVLGEMHGAAIVYIGRSDAFLKIIKPRLYQLESVA